MQRQNRLAITVFVLIGLMGLFAGLFVSKQITPTKKNSADQFHGTLLETPRDVSPFSLMGTDHTPFTNESLKGQWTMLFFGFTQCGYVCPMTMGELGKMYRFLEEQGAKTLPRVVMVSIDPERDHLDKLGQYVTAFDKHFYGARGEDAAVRSMGRELGIAYMKLQGKNTDPNAYELDHTGTVMLFNPQGKLTAFFTSPQNFKHLAEDYLLLVV